eukprot:5165169-Amphidinium_carterae.2
MHCIVLCTQNSKASTHSTLATLEQGEVLKAVSRVLLDALYISQLFEEASVERCHGDQMKLHFFASQRDAGSYTETANKSSNKNDNQDKAKSRR